MARPVGSTTRPQLRSYLSTKEIQALTDKAKEMAMAGNEGMLKFLLEHVYGKAPQPIEGSGENGEFIIKGIEYVKPTQNTLDADSKTGSSMGKA